MTLLWQALATSLMFESGTEARLTTSWQSWLIGLIPPLPPEGIPMGLRARETKHLAYLE